MRITRPIIAFLMISALTGGPPALGIGSGPSRIAIVVSEMRDEYKIAIKGIEQTIEADSRVFDFEKSNERIPVVMNDMEAYDPDLIIALGSSAFKILKKRVSNTPLMFSLVAYPEQYYEPGEKPFGVSLQTDPYLEMKFIREFWGEGVRVGIIYNPRISSTLVERHHKAAEANKLKLVALGADDEKDSYDAIERLKKEVDLFLLIPDPAMALGKVFERLRLESFRRNIPIIGFSNKYIEKDCLTALQPDYEALGALTGQAVSDYLNRGRASGVQYAKKASITINKAMAERLHFSPPKGMDMDIVVLE
ncbi:MAG: hypothetical protein KJ645_08950 [Planctomycetes bacterium]|nr:hypothetical protein [Planctomycetota bacterium]